MSITFRRLASSLLCAAVASLTASACAVDAPAPADTGAPIDLFLDATEVAGPHGPLTQILVPGDEPVTLAGSICECTTSECRTRFIEEQIGCGVCVAFACDGERVGGCVPCGGGLDQPHATFRPPHAGPAPGAGAPAELAPAPSPSLDLDALGQECDEAQRCDEGLTCLTGGMSAHKQRSTCEIACPLGQKQCPSGTACLTISDGPGAVCRPAYWW